MRPTECTGKDFVATNTSQSTLLIASSRIRISIDLCIAFTKEISAISGELFNSGLQRRGRLVLVSVYSQNPLLLVD